MMVQYQNTAYVKEDHIDVTRQPWWLQYILFLQNIKRKIIYIHHSHHYILYSAGNVKTASNYTDYTDILCCKRYSITESQIPSFTYIT